MRLIALFFILSFASCTAQKTKTEPMKGLYLTTTYADGSNNVYSISGNELSYSPMTPEESSSGTYSGGKPATVILQPDEIEKLDALLQIAMSCSDCQIENRVMMSGQILLKKTGEVFILASGSEEKKNLEDFLKAKISDGVE